VAVSGGVDSMALLHALRGQERWKLVVAHVDHGIRPDSAEDRRLVQATAQDSGLPFTYLEARLGPGASEAAAREVRYDFLRKTQKENKARAIITAHHQDDVLETAILNLIRGSGRKGLTSLSSHEDIERPLLDVPKHAVIAYAVEQGLTWREDSTNQDTDYLRNYIRHEVVPRFDDASRKEFLRIINGTRETNRELDGLLTDELYLRSRTKGLDRAWFTQLPHAVARETMAAWLREQGLRDFDSKTLERLVVAAKTAKTGKVFDVLHGESLKVSTDHLALAGAER